MSAKMRSDMYSDQRPSRVPIFHLSRRLAAATVFVVVVFSRLLTSAYTIIISITTSRTRCSLHTFYRNRKERATHAAPCMRSSCKSGCVIYHGPSGRSQPTGSSRRSARAIAVLLPPMSAHASSGPRKTVPLTAPLMAAHSDGGEGRTPTGSHVHISPSRVESTAVTRSPAGSSTCLALGLGLGSGLGLGLRLGLG